jgi:hypothetical protein
MFQKQPRRYPLIQERALHELSARRVRRDPRLLVRHLRVHTRLVRNPAALTPAHNTDQNVTARLLKDKRTTRVALARILVAHTSGAEHGLRNRRAINLRGLAVLVRTNSNIHTQQVTRLRATRRRSTPAHDRRVLAHERLRVRREKLHRRYLRRRRQLEDGVIVHQHLVVNVFGVARIFLDANALAITGATQMMMMMMRYIELLDVHPELG